MQMMIAEIPRLSSGPSPSGIYKAFLNPWQTLVRGVNKANSMGCKDD
jgi:hypothetical protein